MQHNSVQIQPPKTINLDRFIFIERYAPTLIKWDILAFFGTHSDVTLSAIDLSRQLNRNYQVVRRNVGDLALMGVLDMEHSFPHPAYRLTQQNAELRALVQRIVIDSPAPFATQPW